MITVEKFLDCVRENAARVTHYESGGDGSGDGGCDCIGLIIGALRLAGVKWDGTHGSNYTARNEIQEDRPLLVNGSTTMMPGVIVFKGKEPGDPGYDLPEYYKDSGDLTDYYHVGVVMETEPLLIMHCTLDRNRGIDGITEDHKIGNWKYFAELKAVNYNSELYEARVVAETGSTVNLRKGMGTNYDVIVRVPIGSIVKVYGGGNAEWQKVEYEQYLGYMMTKFLAPLPDYIHGDDDNGHAHPDYTQDNNCAPTLDEYREALRQSNEALDRAADVINVLMAQLEANKKLLEGGKSNE